ncbi:FG-GAP-like repeat-containing protein [uncultured Roseobacter sp.]|uniref:DUF4214 domain-containing protein n=1 Tax=uncultured Roseobacter sp. TaxID=114847 RepID=UPI00261DB4FC|nr:FG-GAP-like repeat-containing protein [uncultured Roseobacter sp.]
MDAGGDGLLHRTAWAGDGDGVLFIDDDGDGAISEKKEYVFTEWDPTATDDLAALRAVFDSNDDGVLDASDTRFADFKVLVTNADGSTTAKTLAELGFTSINLTADTTRIELPDGSMITGQTTFTRTDGTTGTVANATLVAEAHGYRVEQVESTDASGNRVVVSTAYAATGDVAYEITSVTSPDGSSITNSYDDDGDGVVDRLQMISTQEVSGNKIETVVNKAGSDAATAIVTSRIVTTTSADGADVTIQRDSKGGGWFDQEEIRSTLPDGSRSIVINDLAEDGSTIRGSSETTSVDGLTRTKGTDEDGDGLDDLAVTHSITEHADDSRTESTVARNRDTSLRSSETLVVGPDGQSKLINRDIDGDGVAETVEDLLISLDAGGNSTSVLEVENADGNLRSQVTQTQSADALSKTIASDVDGDGDVDSTSVDVTVIQADGSRENTVTVTNTDGSVRGMEKTTLGADKVSSEIWVDLDQDGVFDGDERVRSVTIDDTTQERITLDQIRAADGTVLASSTTVSSEDGLTRSSGIDADGDGDVDTAVSDSTVTDGAGVSTRTIEMRNQDGTMRDKTVTQTSADGLTTTTQIDTDGDGLFDAKTVDTHVLNVDGSSTSTMSNYAGDGTTLLGEKTSTESADRLVMTTLRDVDGDGVTDVTSTSTESADGSILTMELRSNVNGSKIVSSQTTTSANGLISSTARDLDGDDITDITETSTTVLNADGSRTTTVTTNNGDASLRSESAGTISDDGLTTTVETDVDGDGVFERAEARTTLLGIDGSLTTISQTRSANDTLLSQSQVKINDDGLITTTSVDVNGDDTFDLLTTATTTLLNDGGTEVTSELRDAAGMLRNASTTTSNDNGRDVTTTTDVNGDSVTDMVTSRAIADDGVLTQTQSEFAADGTLQTRTQTVTSGNGLTSSTNMDADGDGAFEHTQQSSTVLNADGSRTTTTTESGITGPAYRTSTATTSDDGRTRIESRDDNGDGTNDLTVQTTLDLSFDGIETITEERRAADTSLLSTTTTVTSADGRTFTTSWDADGNGLMDAVTTTERGDDGTVTTTESYFSSGGTLEATAVSTRSDDGLTRTRTVDRNADGIAEHVVHDTTVLASDGTTSRTVDHTTGGGVSLARAEYDRSDDGLTRTTRLDVDGENGFEFFSEDSTTFEDNGDVIRHQTTENATSERLSKITTTTSGNGLTTSVVMDRDGDHAMDRNTALTRGAEGGFTEVVTEYGDTSQVIRTETRVESPDGWSTSLSTDLDGDGTTDREITSTVDLSRNVNTTYRDLAADGTVLDEITGMVSANGMQRSVYLDVDGDGSDDLMRTWTTTFNVAGDEITIYEEKAGNGVLADREVTTVAADGLSVVRDIDLDGDGVVDGTMTSTTTLNADGSRRTTAETRYADGDLRSMEDVVISRDGRNIMERHDYNGNGLVDKTSELVIRSDGERILTEKSFGETGGLNNTFVTTTSSDGLITTINRGVFIQTITRSALENGSYIWDNGNSAAQVTVSHEIDAFGIETWLYVGPSETHEARFDVAAKARLIAEAARIYDTVLDRDMGRVETEELVRFVSDGQLDRAALTQELLGSAELATRYGVLMDAAFVAQFYLNTFGRAPSLVELNGHLRALDGGTITRAGLLVRLAESSEHLVVGNTHMATNNFDVIMNPAEYERSLDRAYVEALVKKLIDVVYDRDATNPELSYYSGLLMSGTDNLDDVASKIMDQVFDAQEVQPSSLQNLQGESFVQQAIVNALSKQPTSQEVSIWNENISEGRVTKAQFLASLAQSTDHLEAAGDHLATAASSTDNPRDRVLDASGQAGSAALLGNTGNDTLTGGVGGDTIVGGGGNDTIYGGLGSDDLFGGAGQDTLNGGHGSDKLFGDEGNDLLRTGFDQTGDLLEIFRGTVDDSPGRLLSGDFDNDGKDDSAVFWGDRGLNRFYFREEGGAYEQVLNPVNQGFVDDYPKRFVTGDFNNDGYDDVAILWYHTGMNRFLYGNQDRTFSTGVDLIARGAVDDLASGLVSGDFNGDGYDDLLFHWQNWGMNRSYLGDGAGGFTPLFDLIEREFVNWDQVGESVTVQSGDFNGDGFDDVAFHWMNTGKIRFAYGDEFASFSVRDEIQSNSFIGAGIFETGDLNGDGFTDIVLASRSSGFNHTILGHSGGVKEVEVNLLDTALLQGTNKLVEMGDFDGDGTDEIMVLNRVTGKNEYASVNFDSLFGGDGDDRLVMESGNSTAFGGEGADVFEFIAGRGTISDFEVGTDLIDISAFSLSWNELSISDTGVAWRLSLGENTLVVETHDILGADDFQFV